MAAPLSATWRRSDAVSALNEADEFDLLVVGGGIIGAAVALDAATRGLSVALIEQDDFASGTSSKSTKLLHGGIRYLPQFQFGLIREGLTEQRILRRTADFLFDSLEFTLPVYRGRSFADLPRWLAMPRLLPVTMRMGLTLYDLLGRRTGDDRYRRLSSAEVLDRLPTLRSEGLNGGFAYQDAQTDDTRLTITVLKTAVRRYGVVAASRVRAEDVEASGSGYRVRLTDRLSGAEMEVRTRSVVSATWAFRPPQLSGGAASPTFQLSKGVHLLYRASDLQLGDEAMVLPETEDGRVLFIVPWHGMALLGTTDTAYDGDPAQVGVDEEDADYLHRHLHMYLDVPGVEPIASFAGLRALIDEGGATARASRGHKMVRAAPGYTQILGGKLTAYRSIAAEAVDTLEDHLGVGTASSTDTEVLVGAGVYAGLGRDLGSRLAGLGMAATYGDILRNRYGTEAASLVDLLEQEPALRRSFGDDRATLAEVAHAAAHESILSIADFTLRRTHVAWASRDRSVDAAPEIAAVIGDALGWTDTEIKEAVERYERDLDEAGLTVR